MGFQPHGFVYCYSFVRLSLIVPADTGRDSLRHAHPCEIELMARIALVLGLRKKTTVTVRTSSPFGPFARQEKTRTESERSVIRVILRS